MESPEAEQRGALAWWIDIPLYLRIIGGLILGIILGLTLKAHPTVAGVSSDKILNGFGAITGLILKLLGALAPPLILVAVLDTLIKARLQGGVARRMIWLLVTNTLAAILIGLITANVVQPGHRAKLDVAHDGAAMMPHGNPWEALLGNVPDSLLRPLVDNNVIGVILIGAAFGIALRRLDGDDRRIAEQMVGVAFRAIAIVLHWIIELVPLGVFGIIARVVGTSGFAPFYALGWFVLAVVLGLLLQLAFYLTRVRVSSWVSPLKLLSGMRDAIVMAFSTDSSTATMPVTYRCLRDNVGLRDESARMGALVGTNFNNDGTALYEAMSALFVAQLIPIHLSFAQQLMVVLTSIVASVGAAGIPEAGLVTMTLVFSAVGLPKEYIAMLLTVDWFLDRCRTVINMMGDTCVACLLDGKQQAIESERAMVAEVVAVV
ncbi:MAG TPA: dicarboxylate/amino acid:cation symporter [Tepidisphaeraceae bacterium]|nr:dicarboxylate/amino acid:cation symporter [Tepidisphaeraceae bacterium]